MQVVEPKPSTDATGNPVTTCTTGYTYDVEGHLTGVAMQRPIFSTNSYTQTRTFTYDLPTGHLLSATNPENGTTTYTYFADGTLQSKTDNKGQKTLYTGVGHGGAEGWPERSESA